MSLYQPNSLTAANGVLLKISKSEFFPLKFLFKSATDSSMNFAR